MLTSRHQQQQTTCRHAVMGWSRGSEPKRKSAMFRSPAAAGQKGYIVSLVCFVVVAYVLEKYISFLFLYLKADRPTHVYVMGDKHFPWRPVHLYAFPTTPCVCLFAAGGFRRPAQEKPGINSAVCTYFQDEFFWLSIGA